MTCASGFGLKFWPTVINRGWVLVCLLVFLASMPGAVVTPEKQAALPQTCSEGPRPAEHDAQPIELRGTNEGLPACQHGFVQSKGGKVFSLEFTSPQRVESLVMKMPVAGFGATACPTANDLAVELLKHGTWSPVNAKWAFTTEYQVVALGIGEVWARAVFEGQECAAVRVVFEREMAGEVQKATVNEPPPSGRAPLRWLNTPQADAKYWPWSDDLRRVLRTDSPARSAVFPMIGKAPLGLPDGIGQDACVLWNGTMVLQYRFDGEKGALIVSPLFGEPFRPPGLEQTVQRRLIDNWKPGVVTEWEQHDLKYTQTAFIDCGRPSSLRVRLEIWNASGANVAPSVKFEGALRPLSEFTKPILQNRFVPLPMESEVFRVDHSPERLLGPGERTWLSISAPLATGGRADKSHEDAREEFRRRWDELLAKGAQVRFPDERFSNVWRACVSQLWLSLEDGVMPYGIFPSIYDGVVNGVEEGWSILALAYAGYPEDAQRILSKTYLTPEHLNKSNRHHQYRNGLTAQYAAELFRITGDLEWLRQHKELLKEAAEWTIAQTQSTLKEAPALHAGLLPKYRYGGDLVYPAYSLYSNATCWRGLRDTGILLHALDDPDAARYEEMARLYRKRILASWDAAYRRDAEPPLLPFSLYDKEPRPSSGDYYQLFAPLIFETGILPRRGKQYGWVTDYLEKTGRLVAGQARFGPALGLDAHYTTGYITGLLQEGRRDDFLLSLYGHLALSMDQSVYSMPEVIPLFTSPAQRREMELTRLTDWYNEPEGEPGSWTLTDPCTAGPGVMIKYLRSMLVLEELDGEDLPTGRLLLFAGVPKTWFLPNNSFSATGLPSFYGPVSVSCAATEEEIRIGIEAPQGETRELQFIEMPIPAQTRVTAAGCGYTVEASTLNLSFSGDPIQIILRR